MASLGTFGKKRDEVEVDTFDWFGDTVRVNPGFGELALADFLESAAALDEENVTQSMALLKGTMRECVHADDFDSFWSTAKRERQGIGDLMELLYVLVEAVTDRPTERSANSSGGPQLTSVSSADASSLQVIRQLEQEGRASVAYMVREAEASRASA